MKEGKHALLFPFKRVEAEPGTTCFVALVSKCQQKNDDNESRDRGRNEVDSVHLGKVNHSDASERVLILCGFRGLGLFFGELHFEQSDDRGKSGRVFFVGCGQNSVGFENKLGPLHGALRHDGLRRF